MEPTDGQVGDRRAEPTDGQTGEQVEKASGAQAAEPEKGTAAPGLSAEETDVYEQMALYIQEGFRIYGIDGAYQAYFGPIEEEEEAFSCDILLEGEDELWSEYISYTMDEGNASTVNEGNAWYTFHGGDERIFSGDPFWMLDKEDPFVADLRENYRYKVRIAGGTDLPAAVHYDSEGGPIEKEIWKEVPFRTVATDCGYYVHPVLYIYQDERLDINITIEYPEISLSDEVLEEKVNEALKDAFFYGYYAEDGLHPEEKVYTSIGRSYLVKRQDERYFSVCIYEGNYTRGANHPNEWESGVTIDLKTGEVLHLEDVIGEGRSVKSLLESGAFESLLSWEGEQAQDWIDRLGLEEDEPPDKYDSYFYLTEDGLGIITFQGRYYNCLEAKFEDLDIEGI